MPLARGHAGEAVPEVRPAHTPTDCKAGVSAATTTQRGASSPALTDGGEHTATALSSHPEVVCYPAREIPCTGSG